MTSRSCSARFSRLAFAKVKLSAPISGSRSYTNCCGIAMWGTARSGQVIDTMRAFVAARLLQVNAFRRAIERDFALRSATLRTDAAMHGQTEALLFADFTQRGSSTDAPPLFIMTPGGR